MQPKYSPIARVLPGLLLAVCAPLLGHCGGATEDSSAETSNPPEVAAERLHIVLRDTGVEVVGDPGAVSSGASVRVTNRTSGEQVEAIARADGSVNVVVPGSLQDEYQVTVSNGSGSQTVRISTQTSGGMADAGSGPPGACTALRQALAARVSAGFANVDKTCQRDEECFSPRTDSGCYSSCDTVIASRSGAQAAGTAVVQDIAPLCNEFDNQHCETPILTCVEGSRVLVCNGICTPVDTLSCDELAVLAAARVPTVVNDASRTCSRDNDCVLAQADIRCVPTCGNVQSVASSALQGLRRSIAETEGLYCGSAESLRCPRPLELPCVPPLGTPQATCNAGQCEVTYVSLP